MSLKRKQLLESAYLFLENHDKFTPESVIADRTSSCTHTLLPSSIPVGPRNNSEYSAFIADMKQVMHNFKLHIVPGTEPVVDEVTRRVTLQLTSHSETNIGLYANEYIWILKFSEDGKQIEKIVEFADSAYTLNMLPKLLDELGKNATIGAV